MTGKLKKITAFIGAILVGSSMMAGASGVNVPNASYSSIKSYNVVEDLGYSKKLKNLAYSDVIWMESTAYSRFDPGCGDYTATGDYVRYGIAAVDPDVIPLGTSLYVDGYGHALASDTGGAIQGYRIDLAFDSYEEAENWGRRGVNVYII